MTKTEILKSGRADTEVEALTREITEKIARLRAITIEPVDISYAPNISFEVRPSAEGDRLNVYRKDWGCIGVNYTHEGLIIDVCSESDLAPIHSIQINSDELENRDGGEAVAGPGVSSEQVLARIRNTLSSQRKILSKLPAVAPDDLLERLTPVDHPMGDNFQEAVGMLVRPYMAITREQYHAILMQLASSDVVEFDGIQMTFGSADGGYALMPLANRVPTDGLDVEKALAPVPGG